MNLHFPGGSVACDSWPPEPTSRTTMLGEAGLIEEPERDTIPVPDIETWLDVAPRSVDVADETARRILAELDALVDETSGAIDPDVRRIRDAALRASEVLACGLEER